MTEMQPSTPIQWTLTDIVFRNIVLYTGNSDTLTKREGRRIEGYASGLQTPRVVYFDCYMPGRNLAAITVENLSGNNFNHTSHTRELLLQFAGSSIPNPAVNFNRKWIFIASANLYLPEFEEQEELKRASEEIPQPEVRSCFIYTTEW